MKREIITITDSGSVAVPDNVRMNIGEIAGMFDIYYPAAKRHIRSIEKSGVVSGDYSMCCSGEGMNVYPEYYGLEMIIAVAFRVRSEKAEIFRKWVCRRTTHRSTYISLSLLVNTMILN